MVQSVVDRHATRNGYQVGIYTGEDDHELRIERGLALRNQSWAECRLIPSWVEHNAVGLDRFFTRPDVAWECARNLFELMGADHADLNAYHFVDPGAGDGVFYDLMPPGRRTGVDVVASRMEFVQHDFLTWEPNRLAGPYAVLGNPPFGYRAWLALAFMNHAATFADYIGCILPMGFQSEGKGSPKHRVKGAQLVISEPLAPDSFIDPAGSSVKLNALWQVWRRGVNNVPPSKTCDDWLDLFTVDNRIERLCGQERLLEADYFIQRTYFGEPPKLVRRFSDVRYGCGYGIVLKQDSEAIVDVLTTTDWDEYSNLAMHNCRHISMYHIRQAIIDRGFVDG